MDEVRKRIKQAVGRVRFKDGAGEEKLEMEEANEGEKISSRETEDEYTGIWNKEV